jgi:hypothetical protein
MKFIVTVINYAGDTRYRLAIFEGDEILSLGVKEKRILRFIEEFAAFGNKLRHPVMIIFINFKRNLDKMIQVGFRFNFYDRIFVQFIPGMTIELDYAELFPRPVKNIQNSIQLIISVSGGVTGANQRLVRRHRRRDNRIGEQSFIG